MSLHNTPHVNQRPPDVKLDASASVSDSTASTPKQLLNAYVYDFLVKSQLAQTAKTFVSEAEVPVKPNSPDWSTQNTIPFHKDNNLPYSRVAMDAPQGFLFEWWQVFWDVYLARNNKSSSTMAAQYHQLQSMKQRQQHELSLGNFQKPQSADQQRAMMQFMASKQQQPGFASVDPQNGNVQQQMYMMQQNNGQNRIQQQAQLQMNSLRQQAAAVRDQPSPQNMTMPPHQMGQKQFQGNGVHYSPQMVNGTPYPEPRNGANNVNNGIKNQNPNNRNINALQDYQMQLMLLEKQNKKRLDIARNSGSADPNALATLTAGMLPPDQQQMQQQLQNAANASNPPKPSPNMTGPSPVISNKPSPGTAKKRKEPANKRGRKSSVTNNSTTPSNSAPTPSHLKKDFSTPLTPTSETPQDTSNGKRKRKGSVADSPKKVTKTQVKKDDTIKEEKEEKKDSDSVPPAISSNFHEIGQNDQIFSMDVLDNGDSQLFAGNSNGLEEIDFDFNLFLDDNVNDGINTFNWSGVDAIESGDN